MGRRLVTLALLWSSLASGAGPKSAAAGGGDTLRFVLTPYLPAAELKVAYRPLADRLAARAGRPVELVVADSFGGAVEMLLEGRADLGELTPFAFVSGMERSPDEKSRLAPLAADAMVGRPGTGVVVVAARSSWKSLDELKGARFGFVDEFSSTGFLGPWAMMLARGIDPRTFFASYRFLGSHLAVLEAVEQGTVDAGAVSRHTVDTLLARSKLDPAKFRVLQETARMPGDVICARPELPAAVREALREELLALRWDDPAGRSVLEPMSRKAYTPVDVKEYGWLLRVSAQVKAKK